MLNLSASVNCRTDYSNQAGAFVRLRMFVCWTLFSVACIGCGPADLQLSSVNSQSYEAETIVSASRSTNVQSSASIELSSNEAETKLNVAATGDAVAPGLSNANEDQANQSTIQLARVAASAIAPSTVSGPAASQGTATKISGSLVNPVMFVTQVPPERQFTTRISTFGNHLSTVASAPRGGDLMIRYPNGTLRNLTKEAGFGMEGQQGANAIAVREPSVHWSGNKAVFSMVIGAPLRQYEVRNDFWQMYEVTGLALGQKAVIKKVANQPSNYNNVSPMYGTDEQILFTSDRPRNGAAHLYPQLDEYESSPTTTGIWKLNPISGSLSLLNHAVSGAFSPIIDSFGRVVFTRWDHLQRDQQAEIDLKSPGTYGTKNFTSEAVDSVAIPAKKEIFPEPLYGSSSIFGKVNNFGYNLFTPWTMNEDGTEEETLSHIGRQEFQFANIEPSFADDTALRNTARGEFTANRFAFRGADGIFHIRENPTKAGEYIGVFSPEFFTLSSGQLLKFYAPPHQNPEKLVFEPLTPTNTFGVTIGGKYRNPTYMSDGQLISSFVAEDTITDQLKTDIRLRVLTTSSTGTLSPNQFVTGAGIRKSVSWWSPDSQRTFDGLLWELEAVEVVARVKPNAEIKRLEAPEKSIFDEEGVNESSFKAWMSKSNLALIVTRNQTTRDIADKLQPYNLFVPGGTKTIANPSEKPYAISHFQLLQADQIRGYRMPGRRPIAQLMSDPAAVNPVNPLGPQSSVKIHSDGSTAAFVPSNRAMTWQTTDSTGNPVVRERLWVTFQKGEIRVCASCHGVNSKDQAGKPPPTNPPEALRHLLRFWKTLPK